MIERYKRCRVCGSELWMGTQYNDKNITEKEITDMGEFDYCFKCSEVKTRAPEIYEWVIGVIKNAKLPRGKNVCKEC